MFPAAPHRTLPNGGISPNTRVGAVDSQTGTHDDWVFSHFVTTDGFERMNVVVCDDHLVFVESLAVVFEARNHRVVACVDHPDRAVAALAGEPVEACVLDFEFPDTTRLEALALIHAASPDTKVIVLSGYLDTDRIRALTTAGASMCAVKNCDLGELVDAIEDLVAGEPAPAVLGRPSAPSRAPALDAWERDPQARFLTDRERQVLDGLANGDTTTLLAVRLGVSVATVRTHIQSLLSKLGVHSRVEAVSFAASRSLLPLTGNRDGHRDGYRDGYREGRRVGA